MKKFAIVLFTIISACSLLACNTVQGLGKDIEKGGQAIERAATK
jgi:entericidin B